MSTHPLSRLSDQDLLRDLDALIVEQRANAPELDAHIAEVEARGLSEPDEPHSKMTPIGDGKHRLKLTFRQSVMVRRIQALLDEPLSPGEVVHFALDTSSPSSRSAGPLGPPPPAWPAPVLGPNGAAARHDCGDAEAF